MPETAHILLVGAGGLGHPALWGILSSWPTDRALHICVCDPERVEPSNLNRQIFFQTADIDRGKASTLVERISALLTLSPEWRLEANDNALSAETLEKLMRDVNFVIDACDSVDTKLLINDTCVLHRIAFAHGGVIADYGQVLLYNPGLASGGCLRCLFDSFSDTDFREYATTCMSAGIVGPAAGVLGFELAQQTLNYFFANSDEAAVGSALSRLPGYSALMKISSVPNSPDCPLGCGSRPFHQLDLRGQRCPETYVYTKLALEKLQADAVLQVVVDATESARNISKTVIQEGHTVLQSFADLNLGSETLLIRKIQAHNTPGKRAERTLTN